ncbi:GNAT family N-acetyltransferase [Pedobacter caeni]|uniref:Ribosomal protein S18 acetylase RimI n=1 Tax=Pedobacter caeni TaxID=288992 RepID=A0A1M5A8V7_9SPHI|nr:GNAT family N-acetyltransferase [Pedobacter caeni]SHF26693.1 Ribosomal protein S18 acetylase RimI [Pedobacter caeni]
MEINSKIYTLLIGYQEDEKWRTSFNVLCQKTYRFDYEKWYESGYWDGNCILYSLADQDKVVSHVTVNVIDFVILGEERKLMQVGTVMTDPDYKNQGLSRALMEKVMLDWEDKCDMIYLFANDQVLNFYPKFGFVPVEEYQAVYQLKERRKGLAFRKMDMDDANDRDLLFQTAKHAAPLFKISMKDNAGLVMFYANYFDRFSIRNDLYYIPDLKAVVVAGNEGNTLTLFDIFAPSKVEITEVIHSLAEKETQEVRFTFMPNDTGDCDIQPYKEEDLTLFVPAKDAALFKDHRLNFPMLSHT